MEKPATFATRPLTSPTEKIGPIASACPIACRVVRRFSPRCGWVVLASLVVPGPVTG